MAQTIRNDFELVWGYTNIGAIKYFNVKVHNQNKDLNDKLKYFKQFQGDVLYKLYSWEIINGYGIEWEDRSISKVWLLNQ